MADGREVDVWDRHAQECREQGRVPFRFNGNEWLRSQVVGLKNIDSVLDVGCGPGYWVNLFDGIRSYTGVDQSLEMLKLAKELNAQREGVVFIQGQARELDSISYGLPGKFDLVFTSSVLQHNRHEPDKREIVESIGRVLRPGGYFLCTENTFREKNCAASLNNPGYTDGYSFTFEGWRDFMGGLGFILLGYNGESEYLYRFNR